MIDGVGGARGASGAAASGDGKLRQTALQMEGLFVQKLFAAMQRMIFAAWSRRDRRKS